MAPMDNRMQLIEAMLSGVHTATIVQVISCTNNGDVEPSGTVDVQPLVMQVDSDGHAVPHGPLHSLPYVRLYAGGNMIIMDPQPGDWGIAIFAERDISKVWNGGGNPQAPGSARRFDMADGIYIGGIGSYPPTQYIQFSDAGITLTSPSAVTIDAPQTTINGKTTVNGLLTYTQGMEGSGGTTAAQISGDVVANGISLVNHVHGGVQTGSGNTGEPV